MMRDLQTKSMLQTQMHDTSASVFLKAESDYHDEALLGAQPITSSSYGVFQHPIQPKMKISYEKDHYEREADVVANTVLDRISKEPALNLPPTAMNSSSLADEERPSSQSYTSLSTEDSTISSHLRPTQAGEINHVLQHSGQPLSTPLRSRMEYGFGGEDFSQVQMHTTPNAIATAQSIGAKAFTVGHHIVGDVSKPEVLAHELQHVRQQSHQTSNSNTQTVQCMLTGTLSELRTGAGEPSRKAKAKGFMTFGLAKSTYTQIMEAIFQYESMEGEVESGFDPPPIGTCLRMLEEITSLIDQWFAANQQDQEGRLKRSDLARGETLSRVRNLVALEYSTVNSLGHPDVLRLRQDQAIPRRENGARSRSTTTQGLENVLPPRYSQLPPERYSQLFPDGPPPNFLGGGNLDTILEEGDNNPPVPPRPPRPVPPRTTSSAGVRLRLGTASSNAPWIQPRPEPSSSPLPPPIPLRTTQTRPSTPPSTPPPPIPERPWQNTASNVVVHSSNESPPTPPPRGASSRARPLPSSFFSSQSQQDRTRRHVPVPTTVETNPELSVGAPPSYRDAVGVGRQELRPALWQKLMPSWTKATAINDAITHLIGSADSGVLTLFDQYLTDYSQSILNTLTKAYEAITPELRNRYIRRAYDFVGVLRHYVVSANDMSRINPATFQQIMADMQQLSQMLNQLHQAHR